MIVKRMCPDFFNGRCSGGHRCSHNASILTCVCTTRPFRTWSTGVGMFYRSLLKAAIHHCPDKLCPICAAIRRYVHPAYRRSRMRHRSNDWSYSLGTRTRRWGMAVPTVNVESTVHLWKHHSSACRVEAEGVKTGLLCAIWSPMTMTNVSPTQPLSMRILYPGANEHSPWGCCVFVQCILKRYLVVHISLLV